MSRRFDYERWPRLVAAHRRALAEPEHYVARFPWSADESVGDLGCGPGFFSGALLARLGAAGRLVCVDVEPRMIDRLSEREPPDPRRRTAVADLSELPLATGALDTAWCAFALHEVDDLEAVVGEAARVLRSGGRLIALEWDPRPTEHGPPAAERISEGRIRRAMAAGGFAVGPSLRLTDSQYGLVGLRP